jgi:hypothetical protein
MEIYSLSDASNMEFLLPAYLAHNLERIPAITNGVGGRHYLWPLLLSLFFAGQLKPMHGFQPCLSIRVPLCCQPAVHDAP